MVGKNANIIMLTSRNSNARMNFAIEKKSVLSDIATLNNKSLRMNNFFIQLPETGNSTILL